MARFFKTSSAAPIDYMYKLPTEFMVNVQQNTESQIDNVYNSLDLIKDTANINTLTADSEQAKSIIDTFNQDIDSLTSRLQKNALDYKKLQPNIRDLSRKLQTEFKNGDLGRIQSNYLAAQNYDKEVEAMVKAGKLTPQEGLAFRSHAYSNYKGYKNSDGSINTFSGETPMDAIDFNKWADEQLKNLVASGQITWNTKAGQYMVKNEQGQEYKDPNKIFEILSNAAMGDTRLLSYINQRQRMGILNGVINDKGDLNLLDPSNPILKNSDGSQSLNILDNTFTRALRAAMGEHSFIKTKGGTSLSTNALYNQTQAHQNTIEMAGINAKNAREKVEYESALAKDIYDYKRDNPTPEEIAKTAKQYTDMGFDSKTAFEMARPKITKNEASGTYTVSPLASKPLTLKNLTGDLVNYEEQVKNLTALRDKEPVGSNMYNHYQQLLYEADIKLTNTQSIWNNTYNQARASLTKKEAETLNDVHLHKNAILKRIAELENIQKNKVGQALAVDNVGTHRSVESEELNDLRQKLIQYNRIEEKFNKKREEVLLQNSKNSSYVVGGVKPTDKQVNSIMTNIMNSSSGFGLYDLQTGQSLDKSKFSSGFKGSQLSFQGTGEDMKNLRTYMQKNNLTPSDIMDMESLIHAPGEQGGLTAVVTFKNLPGLPFDKNKKIGMRLDASSQLMIANSLNDRDKASLELKESITNGQKQYIRNKLGTYRNTDLGLGEKGVVQKFSIPDTKGQIYTIEYQYENIGSSQPGIRANLVTANGEKIKINGRDIFFNADDLANEIYGK
jgi:hypothetical protein